ncbi:xanthine dehydrogenase family protein molybdopterin-binding subunit [Consotaella aegiceratis]|uniref:xanthine dehydrogenase family protein molybdopterin-binding subunit n=1 Tax=Consotaella aegiceratis TaxID=3097961 RepID=UPI002F3FACFB
MDDAIDGSRLDQSAQGLIGQPVDRYEGRLKVAGRAPYAYEAMQGGSVAYGAIVAAGFGPGRLISIDPKAALAAPGVLHVVIDDKAVRASADPGDDQPPRVDGLIVHTGQAVALVVAETFEVARHAATLVKLDVESEPGRYDLEAGQGNDIMPDGEDSSGATKGDFEAAFAAAEVQLDVIYATPSQSHSAMEPHAAIAEWQGDRLTVHCSNQLVASNTKQLAAALDIDPEKVRLITPYIGGGFGGKLGIGVESVYAALAAKTLGRPVKVALSRQQVYQMTSRRTDTLQRMRLGARSDGTLTAIAHDTWCGNLEEDPSAEPAGLSTVFLYAGDNRQVTHHVAPLDLLRPSAMRAPGEAVGMLALENAMDEMAEKLGLDPIEFRKRNEPEVNPQDGRPFSSRYLIDCMEEGAKRFGWDERPATPGSRRDGEWLIGYGMAAASRANMLQPSSAEVSLRPDGSATIKTDMTDIGTGSYTILAQTAGELLGLAVDRIDVQLGDSSLPKSSGSGGSFGAASSTSSVYVACLDLIGQLAAKLDVAPEQLTLKDGTAIAGNRQVALADLLAGETLTVEGTIEPGRTDEEYHQACYGAHFCEVAVSAVTGETRVKRMLSVCEAGRILNPKTATSQCYGGLIFGIGTALTEELVADKRTGLMVNHDLAEYHVPVNADVPQLEVVLLDRVDQLANPMAAKGIGELAISGAGAAITNAIYNACGVRVRSYPMTLDKVLAGLEKQSA